MGENLETPSLSDPEKLHEQMGAMAVNVNEGRGASPEDGYEEGEESEKE